MNRTNDPGTSNFRSRILRPAGVLAGSMVLLVGAGVALVHFALRPAEQGDALHVGLTAHGGRESASGSDPSAQSSSISTANASRTTKADGPLTMDASDVSDRRGEVSVPVSTNSNDPDGTRSLTANQADVVAAERAFEAGNFREAVLRFTVVTEQDPDGVWGHYMLGLSQWKAGATDQAEASLMQALDRDPHHLKSLVNLARVRLEQGEQQKALVPISRAVEIAPNHVEAHRVHGRVLHNLGVGAQAEVAYARALSIDPQDGWTLNNLGLLWIEAGEFTEALGPLARAVQVEPGESRIWNNLGVALERAERYGAATEAYAKALDADSTFSRARVSLIRVRPHVAGQSWPDPDLTQLANEFDPSKPLLAAIRGPEPESTESAQGTHDTVEALDTSAAALFEGGEVLSVTGDAPVNVVATQPLQNPQVK